MNGVARWREVIPAPMIRGLRTVKRTAASRARRRPVDLGDLRRLAPIDPHWGYGRGEPIDRAYIDAYLAEHASDIRGRVLEIASPKYTLRYGGDVTRADVLMVDDRNPDATIVADLTDAPHIPDETFDCAIVTQTLQFVYDIRAALATLSRILTPGGVLLMTVPGITKISEVEDAEWGQWWHLTSRSARRLVDEAFGEGTAEVRSYGNVLSATAFLYGLAVQDLRPEEIQANDRLYEVIVGVRAVRAARVEREG